jgi:hypothetical protein
VFGQTAHEPIGQFGDTTHERPAIRLAPLDEQCTFGLLGGASFELLGGASDFELRPGRGLEPSQPPDQEVGYVG